MEHGKAIEFKVGLLIVTALALLAVFIFVLGNFSMGKGFQLLVHFDFIGSLQPGAPVKVAGIQVGKVDDIQFLGGKELASDKRPIYVRVKLWLEDRAIATIHRDAEFFINTQGVLGEQYIEVVPGTPKEGALAAGEAVRGVSPPRVDLVVSRLYEFLDGATRLLRDDKQTISDLLRSSSRTMAALETLLSGNQQEIKQLIVHVDELSNEGTKLVASLHRGIGNGERLDRILGQVERTATAVGRDADTLVAQANRALEGVANITSAVGKPEQERIRVLLRQLSKLGDRAYALADRANKLVERLSRGEGTAGALLVKDDIYDDVKEMVRDLKRNPWKFLWRE